MYWSAISRLFSHERFDGPLVTTATRRLSLAAALTSVALLGNVQAATLTWDSNTIGSATDGSGTWDTTTLNWILTGTTHTTWNNATPDAAVIGSGGTAGTITLGVPITSDDITFRPVTGNYIVTGNTLTLASTPVFIRVDDDASTINSVVAGAPAGLGKVGTGTLTLSGANTYSGLTAIFQGAVRATNSASLGDTTGNTIVFAGAALELENSIGVASGERVIINGTGISGGGAIRNISGNNSLAFPVTLLNGGGARINSDSGLLTLSGVRENGTNNKVLTFGGAGNVTVSGAITADNDDLRLVKDGAGTLTLGGANTYTGTTTITDGTLLLGASNRIADTSNVVLNGGTLATGGNSDTVGSLTVSASSVADMGVGASLLTFASISSWTAPLQVWNWTGTINTAGGTDRLLFTSTATGPGSVQFYSDLGFTTIGSGGAFVGNELVPVPEPGAVLAGLLLLAPVAWRERRLFMRVRG